jgi:hypothetical protein
MSREARGNGLRFNTKFSDLRLNGETGSGAGAGVHSGPSGVSLIDVACHARARMLSDSGVHSGIRPRWDPIS